MVLKDVESIEMENDTLREDLGSVERKLAERQERVKGLKRQLGYK
jgi:hypothetical protein